MDQANLYLELSPFFCPQIQGFHPLAKLVQTELFLIWDHTSSRAIEGDLR